MLEKPGKKEGWLLTTNNGIDYIPSETDKGRLEKGGRETRKDGITNSFGTGKNVSITQEKG